MRFWALIQNVLRILGLIAIVDGPAIARAEFHPGDVNCDSLLNSVDIVYLVNYCFKSGPAPCGAYPPASLANSGPGIRMDGADAAVPGGWDTLRLDPVVTCDSALAVRVGLYLHNHDSLLTLFIPLRVEQISGDAFIRYDSAKWIDRIWGPHIMDGQAIAPMVKLGDLSSAVDGVSPDWVGILLEDGGFGYGLPPLDSGAGYLCELYFTPLGSSGGVQLTLDSWGIFPEVGFVEFEYDAREFSLVTDDGLVEVVNSAGTGDLNCDLRRSAIDIIALVRLVFQSGQ